MMKCMQSATRWILMYHPRIAPSLYPATFCYLVVDIRSANINNGRLQIAGIAAICLFLSSHCQISVITWTDTCGKEQSCASTMKRKTNRLSPYSILLTEVSSTLHCCLAAVASPTAFAGNACHSSARHRTSRTTSLYIYSMKIKECRKTHFLRDKQ